MISSYMGSLYVIPSALFDYSRAALIFALLLIEIIITATLAIKAVARELSSTTYTVLVCMF